MRGLAQPPIKQDMDDSNPNDADDQSPNFQGEGDPNIGAGLREEPANEQEQAMYDALVEPMLGMIHGEQTKDQVVKALQGGMTIAEMTYQIGSTVVGEVEKQGKKVPEDILQLAAEDVVEDLVEISVKIGIIPNDQKKIEQAYIDGLMGAIDMYGAEQRKMGRMSPEDGAKHIDEMTALGGFEKNKVAGAVQQEIRG